MNRLAVKLNKITTITNVIRNRGVGIKRRTALIKVSDIQFGAKFDQTGLGRNFS